MCGRYAEQGICQCLVNKADEQTKSLSLQMAGKPPSPACRLLDLGAGNASFSASAAQHFQTSKVYVLDAVNLANAWCLQSRDKGIAVHGLVATLDDSLPYPDASFDVVLSNGVIEHLYDPFIHLREIHRVLNETGYAIIGTPNLSGIQYRLMLLLGFMPTTLAVGCYEYDSATGQQNLHVKEYYRHITCFTMKEFKKILISIGFEILEARTAVIHLLPTFLALFLTKFFPWGNAMIFKIKKK